MAQRPFSNADPFLQIIVLFLLCFSGVTIFMFIASGLIEALWGVDFISNAGVLVDYSNPQIIQINRVLLLFQHIGLFILPSIVFALLITTKWKQFLGFRKAALPFAIGSILVMIAAMPAINGLAWINEQISLPDALAGLEQSLSGMEDNAAQLTKAITETNSPWIFIFNVLVVAVLPALGEEMIFRGALIPLLIRWTGKRHNAVWISAFLFSAMHMQFYGFLPRMLLGALLGYLFIWSRSLWAPVLAHFTNNALAVFLIFMINRGSISADVDSFTPDSSSILWFIASLAAVGIISFFLQKRSKTETRPLVIIQEIDSAEEESNRDGI